jgi:hypothetical protein
MSKKPRKSDAKAKTLAPTREYFLKGNHTNNLLHAVADFVRERDGRVVVAGDVRVLRWPTDADFVFDIAVRCTGRIPTAGLTQTSTPLELAKSEVLDDSTRFDATVKDGWRIVLPPIRPAGQF